MRARQVLTCVIVLLATACSAGENGGSAPKVTVDHSTTAAAVASLADSGPAPGTLGEFWHTDVRVPGGEAQPWQSQRLVDGQIVVATEIGVDVYDASTGRQRWHYHEPGRELVAYAETAGSLVVVTSGSSKAKDRWTGLEARTGRIVWTSGGRGFPLKAERDPGVVAGQGVVAVMPEGRDFGHKIRGIDARTGHDRWLEQPPGHGCDADPLRQVAEVPETDGSLFVLKETCAGRPRAFALDPATGKVRWVRDVAESSTIIVRDRFSLINDAGGIAVVAADGRELAGAPGSVCTGCRFEVTGDHGVVTSVSQDRQLLLIDLRGGRVTPRPAGGHYYALTTAAGQMYALRQRVSQGKPGSPELLPAGLDVIDPVAGTVVSRPLPFALGTSDVGLAGVNWIAMAGGRLYTSRTVAGAIRIVGYAITTAGTPAELGGVKQPDWPDACTVAPGYKPTHFSEFLATAKIGQISLQHMACTYRMNDDVTAELSIRWVAPTPEDARRLLVTDGQQPPRDRVDGADEAYLLSSASELWFRAGRYIVSIDRGGPAANALASAAAKLLRTR
jgi:outer membrane protein assembly factor BamB